MQPTRTGHSSWRRVRYYIVAIFGASLATGHLSQAQPVCSPRSISEPGRLNMSVAAEDFGLLPPCRATVSVYIAQNTNMRRIDGTVRASAESSGDEGSSRFSIVLDGPSGGLYKARIPLPIINAACITAAAELEIHQCLDGAGTSIRCPMIRLAGSDGFGSLALIGSELNACTDR